MEFGPEGEFGALVEPSRLREADNVYQNNLRGNPNPMCLDDDDADLEETLGHLGGGARARNQQFSLIDHCANPFKDQEGFVGGGYHDPTANARSRDGFGAGCDLDDFGCLGLEGEEASPEFLKRQQEEYEKLQRLYMSQND